MAPARMSGCVSVLAFALAACAPNPAPPVSFMAMTEGADGTYAPTQVQIQSLSDIVGMKGTVADLVGNARIVLDENDPALMTTGLTAAQTEAVFLKDEGQPPTADYVEQAGVYWPADFHTWNMVTAYYNLEQAFDYFQNLGIFSGTDFAGATVYYWPSFTIVQDSASPQTDDLRYYSQVQAILILPFSTLQAIPLAMNAGAVTREFERRIFNGTVYEGQLFPQPLGGDIFGLAGTTPQVNTLNALDEGLADYFAYAVSCSSAFGCTTRFLEASDGQAAADLRDFSQSDKCMTVGLETSLCTLDANDFINQGLQFQVGTDFAAALWHAEQNSGQGAVIQKAVLSSYTDTTPSTPGLQQLLFQNLTTQTNITLGAIVNTVLLHTPTPLQQEVCSDFMDSLQLTLLDICPQTGGTTGPCGCPATAASHGLCPNINPTGQNTVCPGF
jgi:hypothetical protein